MPERAPRAPASVDTATRPDAAVVYVIGSRTAAGWRTYVGWTLDLDRRLARHNAGSGAKSTRGRTWVLLHVEHFATRREAMSREWHLKRDRALRRRLAQAAAASR